MDYFMNSVANFGKVNISKNKKTFPANKTCMTTNTIIIFALLQNLAG